jgi:hypothetical protein
MMMYSVSPGASSEDDMARRQTSSVKDATIRAMVACRDLQTAVTTL